MGGPGAEAVEQQREVAAPQVGVQFGGRGQGPAERAEPEQQVRGDDVGAHGALLLRAGDQRADRRGVATADPEQPGGGRGGPGDQVVDPPVRGDQFEDPLEVPLDRAPGVLGGQRLRPGFGDQVRGVREDLADQGVAGREVPVEGGVADTRLLGDLVERDVQPVPREQVAGGGEQEVAVAPRVEPQPRGGTRATIGTTGSAGNTGRADARPAHCHAPTLTTRKATARRARTSGRDTTGGRTGEVGGTGGPGPTCGDAAHPRMLGAFGHRTGGSRMPVTAPPPDRESTPCFASPPGPPRPSPWPPHWPSPSPPPPSPTRRSRPRPTSSGWVRMSRNRCSTSSPPTTTPHWPPPGTPPRRGCTAGTRPGRRRSRPRRERPRSADRTVPAPGSPR